MRISDWSSDVCSSDLGEDRKQRLDQSHHVGVVAGELVDPGGKDLAPRRAELEAGFAQRRPHHVLERAHLVQNRTPRHQERSPLPALSALNVNLLVPARARSEEHTSELQSLMRISYAVFCLK